MSIRLKPKTYGPLVVDGMGADGDDVAVTFTTPAGQCGRAGIEPGKGVYSPADLMLAALGSCIAISLPMAAQMLALQVADVQVTVSGHKASDLPHRISHFVVDIAMDTAADAETIARLLAKTKELCTMSNTITADIAFNHRSAPRS